MKKKKIEKIFRELQNDNSIALVLNAFTLPLTEEEILQSIPPAVMAIIKQKDATPYFRAFAIAHEGIITPRVGEKESKFRDMVKATIRVVRSAVESLRVRQIGVPFYDDYHADGNRKEIGREVAQIHKEINGNLHAISVVYSPPETREILKDRDIVSMEAAISPDDLQQTQTGLIMKAIGAISAVATGRSQDGKEPAWIGARAMGQVYGFSEAAVIEKEETHMADTPHMLFKVDSTGMPDVASMDPAVARSMIQNLIRGKNFLISDFMSWESAIGKMHKTESGETIWNGGDPQYRGELMAYKKQIEAPFLKNQEVAEGWKKDIISLRTQSFKDGLLKAAIEEAPRHKFDEKLTKILLNRISEADPRLGDDVLLNPDENARTAAFTKVAGDILKSKVDSVRAEWAAVQGDKPAPQEQPQGIQPASSAGGAW